MCICAICLLSLSPFPSSSPAQKGKPQGLLLAYFVLRCSLLTDDDVNDDEHDDDDDTRSYKM